MSFIYALISRDPDIVLCDYSDYTGNFMQIARVVLQKGIKQNAKFSIQRIDEIEKEVRHDVIAFLTNVNESVGAENAKYIHMGLTSSDVIDTAFALQIKDSTNIILKEFVWYKI